MTSGGYPKLCSTILQTSLGVLHDLEYNPARGSRITVYMCSLFSKYLPQIKAQVPNNLRHCHMFHIKFKAHVVTTWSTAGALRQSQFGTAWCSRSPASNVQILQACLNLDTDHISSYFIIFHDISYFIVHISYFIFHDHYHHDHHRHHQHQRTSSIWVHYNDLTATSLESWFV